MLLMFWFIRYYRTMQSTR